MLVAGVRYIRTLKSD